jgi:hypothetical protein
MPAYAFLTTPLCCPSCGVQLDDQVWFQWGFAIDRAQRPGSIYSVGDAIRWHRCSDGRIPAWTYFYQGDSDHYLGGNLGTPDEPNVVVRDWANTQHQGPCPSCGTPLGSTAVEIRDGRIVCGWITRAGELPPEENVFRRGPEGKLEPLGADDHPMDVVYDC